MTNSSMPPLSRRDAAIGFAAAAAVASIGSAPARARSGNRRSVLRNYLTHLQRATAEGYPVRGYFLWSLMDDFGWGEGYSKRFGIHHTDFATQQRTPKFSATWHRELIRQNALV